MELKQSMNLLLIALFVWAFQSTTIHYQHHEIEEISECNVCHATEQMELYQHSTPVVMSNENIAVKIRRDVEKVVINSGFDYTDVTSPKYITNLNDEEQSIGFMPLGFNATAPPIYFS